MSVGDHAELKKLETRKAEAERELKVHQDELTKAQTNLSVSQADVRRINQQIMQLKQKSNAILVSEHAILRYLERVKHVDIESLKRELLPDITRAQIQALGNGSYPVGKTHRVRVANSVVVTILTEGEK